MLPTARVGGGSALYQQRCEKRYGFIYVDRTDDDPKECARLRKDSFYWYKHVIATNGEEL